MWPQKIWPQQQLRTDHDRRRKEAETSEYRKRRLDRLKEYKKGKRELEMQDAGHYWCGSKKWWQQHELEDEQVGESRVSQMRKYARTLRGDETPGARLKQMREPT